MIACGICAQRLEQHQLFAVQSLQILLHLRVWRALIHPKASHNNSESVCCRRLVNLRQHAALASALSQGLSNLFRIACFAVIYD